MKKEKINYKCILFTTLVMTVLFLFFIAMFSDGEGPTGSFVKIEDSCMDKCIQECNDNNVCVEECFNKECNKKIVTQV